MQAAAHRDAARIQRVGYLAGGQGAHVEADQQAARRRVEGDAGNRAQACAQPLAQAAVVCGDLGFVLAQEAHARGEPGDAGQVERAALEAVGHVLGLKHTLRHAARAALAQRAQRDALTYVQAAGAVRAEQALVAGKGQQVRAQLVRARGHEAQALRRIDQQRDARAAA